MFRGGGQIFGPEPRDYNNKVNKKLKNLARKSALSYKAKDKSIVILEKFNFKNPKTKDFVNILSNFSIENKKSIFFLSENDKNIFLSSNNVKNAYVKNINEINTYDIINSDSVFIVEDSIEKLNKILN